jgi:hypothetical protein
MSDSLDKPISWPADIILIKNYLIYTSIDNNTKSNPHALRLFELITIIGGEAAKIYWDRDIANWLPMPIQYQLGGYVYEQENTGALNIIIENELHRFDYAYDKWRYLASWINPTGRIEIPIQDLIKLFKREHHST